MTNHLRGWSFFYHRMGFERAAPVLALVQKVSGGHFLARGRIHEFSDTSGTDAGESSFGLQKAKEAKTQFESLIRFILSVSAVQNVLNIKGGFLFSLTFSLINLCQIAAFSATSY